MRKKSDQNSNATLRSLKFRSIAHFIALQNFHTLSLDIFDTLLLRGLKPEHARFWCVSRKIDEFLEKSGYKRSISDIFLSRLLSAEVEYRSAPLVRGEREGRFINIIALQLKSLKLPNQMLEDFIRIEIEHEIRSLSLNKPLLELCRMTKNRGKRLILISDMYLDEKSIAKILDAHGIQDLFDFLYVSSDYGVTKAGSRLFEHVSNIEGLEPEGYLHLGDNYYSDVLSARSKGWGALWVPRGISWRLLNSISKKLYRFHPDLAIY